MFEVFLNPQRLGYIEVFRRAGKDLFMPVFNDGSPADHRVYSEVEHAQNALAMRAGVLLKYTSVENYGAQRKN